MPTFIPWTLCLTLSSCYIRLNGGSELEVAQRDTESCCNPCPSLSPALLIYEMSARFLGSEWAGMKVPGISRTVACCSLLEGPR